MNLYEELARLPSSWGFVAVNGQKQPYQTAWQDNPLTKDALESELRCGSARAIGVCCGVPSGGLLFLDHDGKSASTILRDWGCPMSQLPKSWTVTSGRDGRFQVIYQVPEQYWADIATRKYKSGVTDSEGKPEQIELRWSGSQSVVAGAHPLTVGYRWVKNYSPDDLEIAVAPFALIERMLKPAPIPVAAITIEPRNTIDDADRARSYLAALSPARADDYDMWLEVGMSLHSIGDDSLLDDWQAWSQQSSKCKPADCAGKWRSFKKSGITLGTLGDMAKKDGWQSSTPKPRRILSPSSQTAPILTKPEKLEAAELLAFLRSEGGDIRFNTFTQQIEIRQAPIQGLDRFYLTLAERGYKVSKELAIDCLVQVANENSYDPVCEYLNDVAARNNPGYIDRLATTYLRPCDADTKEPTIYDEMLKRTLIAAVRRAFEPGAKHDTACVLMGDQGAYKSSFWGCLGGPFFSDALGDISTKDDLMVLHRSWIMEWAELDHITNRKHAGLVKSFLSQSIDIMRVPYGKAVEAFPRRGIIVGSTNKSTGFLVDETGNRRFWVIPTTKTQQDQIDTAALLLERDEIWSAAVHAYRNKESSHLPRAMEQQLTEENETYLVSSPWESVIREWLAKEGLVEVSTERVLRDAIQKPTERQTRIDQMQVGDVLRTFGFVRVRSMVNGRRQWIYRHKDCPT